MIMIKYCIGKEGRGNGRKMLKALGCEKAIMNITLGLTDDRAEAELDKCYCRPLLWFKTDDGMISGMDINTTLSKMVMTYGDLVEF